MKRWAASLSVFLAILPALAVAQCNRLQTWSANTSYVDFAITPEVIFRVYGAAGQAYQATAMGPSHTMAHVGRSFVPMSWQVIASSDAAAPSHNWSFIMKRVRVADPAVCAAVDQFYATTSGSSGDAQITVHLGGTSFAWGTSGTFNTTALLSNQNSFPGEWVMMVGRGSTASSTSPTTIIHTKAYFYSVNDANYETNDFVPAPGDPDYGVEDNVPYFDEGAGGGITPEDLNEQNVNQEGFWLSLFIPDQEVLDEFIDALQELKEWGPFGFFNAFYLLVEEYEMEEGAYTITIPSMYGNLTWDMSYASGFIRWSRHIMTGILWWIVVMQIKNRIYQKM